MKLLIETTGNFLLIDFNQNGAHINSNRPTVIGKSAFIDQRMAMGQIKLFSNAIPDIVTDIQFEKYWASCLREDGTVDKELAIQSFLADIKQFNELSLDDQNAKIAQYEQDRLEDEKDQKEKAAAMQAEAIAKATAAIAAEQVKNQTIELAKIQEADKIAADAAAKAADDAKKEADAKAAEADAKAAASTAAAKPAAKEAK